jgi:hypothetical protein
MPSRGGREAPERDPPGGADGHGRDDLRDHDRDHRLRQSVLRADRDRRQPQPHRDGKEDRAHVISPVEHECGRRQALGRLGEREQRGDEQGPGEPVRAEQGVGERRHRGEGEPGQHGPERLHAERAREQPPQSPPVLVRRVPEAVLRHGLFHRQVEERLEEPRPGHHDREQAELAQPQDARRDDRAEEPEERRRVDAEGGRGTPPQEPRGHNSRPV